MARPFTEPPPVMAVAGASPPHPHAAAMMSNHVVNPATIPIRTSSSNAVAGSGEREREREKRYSVGNGNSSTSPTSPKKAGPKKHRSLGSVPEEQRYGQRRRSQARLDEGGWLAQGRGAGGNHPNTNGHAANGNGDGGGEGFASGSNSSNSGGRGFTAQPNPTSSQQHPTLSPTTSRDPLAHDGSIHPATTLSDPSPTPTPSPWSAEKESILLSPYTHLESHPGKDIRTQLITAFDHWLRVPPASLSIITKVIGMLHTASLLIDDVEDGSTMRRGVPSAHKIYGEAQTINSANYVYFCALQELLTLESVAKAEVVGIYAEELVNLHRGQGMDLFWRDTLTCPSEEEYLEMVGHKTGGLFRLAIKLMCAASPSHNGIDISSSPPSDDSSNENDGANGDETHDGKARREKTDYIPLANTIGTLFQILDDYLNLNPSPTKDLTALKGQFAEDLTEGKFSFPVIHAIRSHPGDSTVLNILKQKTSDDEVKRFAVGFMEEGGTFAYTRSVLRDLGRRAAALVEEVEESLRERGVGGGGDGDGRRGGDGVRAILEKLRVERPANDEKGSRVSV